MYAEEAKNFKAWLQSAKKTSMECEALERRQQSTAIASGYTKRELLVIEKDREENGCGGVIQVCEGATETNLINFEK